MFKASKKGDSLGKLMLLGVSIVLIATVLDHLSGIGIITLPPLASIAIAFNVLLVILSLSQNYVHQVRELISLNKTLDQRVKERTIRLYEANQQLNQLASFDGLTNILNRRAFDDLFKEHFTIAKSKNTNLSLIMIDIDQFKIYNDTYGHVQGDHLLIDIVQLIKKQLPLDAVFARYGGEEFIIMLPEMTLTKATERSELIRQTIEQNKIENPSSQIGYITISLGVAERRADERLLHPVALIQLADERLYHSKNSGRNRTTSD